MIAEKTYSSYAKFFEALDELVDIYMQHKYEYGMLRFYNEISNCSCGQCHPGYELEEAAVAYFEDRVIRIHAEPNFGGEKALREFIAKM